MVKWLIFIKERFSPAAYLPMILVFTASHGAYLKHTQSWSFSLSLWGYVTVFIFSFFLRMRLFDEIKDYEVDLKINPTRPLARGLLRISEVKRALLFLIVLELVMTWNLGPVPFFLHAAAIGYSLMMYEEFFIGDFLRPHLTTYAVTHTFVCSLLGISTLSSLGSLNFSNYQKPLLAFVLMNWFYFNLFEFARKTWAASEERESVQSYSKIFGLWGSLVLCLSQVAIGLLLLTQSELAPATFDKVLIAAIVYGLLSLIFPLRATPRTASFFRGLTGVYLLTHYLILTLA